MTDLSFVHRFARGQSRSTILVLHGTGGNEDDLVPLARQIEPSANLLSPRGQVLEHGMPRFFRRDASGVFDEADLVQRAADLAAFVRAAVDRYALEGSRLFAFGYSNGANMAAALLLLHADLFAGGLLLRATLPLDPPVLPNLSEKPVYIAAGSNDAYLPAAGVEALAHRLRRAGAEVELRWQSAGHELTREEVLSAGVWARTAFNPTPILS